jgi:minor extracellular serine protease Vpr
MSNMCRLHRFSSLLFILASLLAANHLTAAYRGSYALILADKPAAQAAAPGTRRGSAQFAALRDSIQLKQQAVVERVQALGFPVTGRMNTLLNAVFVRATEKDRAKLQAIPGVLYVAPMRQAKPMLNEAVGIVGAPNAWNGALGGVLSAGTGQKIAILDTGIDYTHPAFQTSLAIPSGFPKCDIPANCAYTNNKVIVARSYVSYEAGTDPATDFPDDTSPRDRVGHGTAVAMAAAGKTVTGPLVAITGLAPQAYLGNYKIYGSPGVNDGASEQGIMQALEDAFNDTMDVATLSSALLPLADPGSDPLVAAIENSITGGMVVVLAGGNDGGTGVAYQSSTYATLNSITSPGDTPDAITVGATGNARFFAQSVKITGPNVPGSLGFILAVEGNGLTLHSNFTAPLLDAATIGDGYGCDAYAAGSMTGYIGLVERGSSSGTDCTFEAMTANIQAAGALGVLIYDNLGSESAEPLFPISTIGTSIPAFFVGNADGLSIKAYVDSVSGAEAVLDPTLNSNRIEAPDVNQVTYFSSRGPVMGSYAIKPDVAAPGENIYTAAQNLDPNGALYDSSRYTLTNGTSFATPIVAGIAAMVRQKNPTFTPLQVKSALVDTANPNATDDPDFTGLTFASPSTSAGGGMANALAAVTTTVTVEPASISFGLLTNGASLGTLSQPLLIVNQSTASETLALSVNYYSSSSSVTVAVDSSSITLAAGASQTVHLTLSGTVPTGGLYDGSVSITGGSSPLQVPYIYMVGTGTANDVFPLAGNQDVGFTGQSNSQGFSALKVVDQWGVAMSGVPVTWGAVNGGAVASSDATTDSDGIAQATFTLGPTANQTYQYTASVSGLSALTFNETAIAQPTIGAGGVVNAASFALGQGIAPGSLVAVFGTGLAGVSSAASYTPLPISMPQSSVGLPTSVGFDAAGVSVPAPLLYVSPGQVNIQVPWELNGQTSAQMKVNIEPMNGALFTVPVAAYSPACFTSNGIVIAQNYPGFSLVTPGNPAVPGQYVILYCNGLGPVNKTPASGAPAPDATSTTTTQPVVTIGGESATVAFSGLTPGLVGVYQLNVQVPADAASGSLPLVLSIGGVQAAPLNIEVQ